MSLLIGNPLLQAASAAAEGGYQISRSLRFNSSDSAYLSRAVPTAGSLTTWTWAAWVKRSSFDTTNNLFAVYPGSNFGNIRFANQNIDFAEYSSGSYSGRKTTTAVFRDPSAWYHIVATWDTTNGTAADRMRLYVNGVRVDAFSTSTDPGPSATSVINTAATHRVGTFEGSTEFFNGYLADVHFIDGQALDPTSFTEVDATTGQLVPKAYSGSFGTNGFWLKFSDNSAATATTLGKDYSGNSNNWTPNNLSVTAGSSNDSLVDTPTNYGVDDGLGGSVRGNYCTLNPIDVYGGVGTITDGNMRIQGVGSGQRGGRGTIAFNSGKYYWEIYVQTAGSVSNQIHLSANNPTESLVSPQYFIRQDGSGSPTPTSGAYFTFTSGDLISCAVDQVNGTVTWSKNGASGGPVYSFTPGTLLSPNLLTGDTGDITFNFGQRPFAYTAPSGFKALCTTNLDAPVVAKPSTVMDVLIWTGDGTNGRTIGGLSFEPDFVWMKIRSGTLDHRLWNSIISGYRLFSNNTNAEDSTYGAFSTSSTGLVVSASVNDNNSGQSYVAWNWDAGSSTVSNSQGSITSQVRANTSAGFSIVTFTSNASGNATVGHGLGVAPSLVILKNRTGGAGNWLVFHKAVCTKDNFLYLNSTNALGTYTDAQGAAIPSSTVFGINAGIGIAGSADCVAYVFSPVAGYSSFGSYTGNGSADGPFVYTGFRSRFILIKASSIAGEDWVIIDTARSPQNVSNLLLKANSSDQEASHASAYDTDLLSNGFKIRNNNPRWNQSGVTYVWASFAENPFKTSRAR